MPSLSQPYTPCSSEQRLGVSQAAFVRRSSLHACCDSLSLTSVDEHKIANALIERPVLDFRVSVEQPPIRTELENGVMSGLATIRPELGKTPYFTAR
jgi:hypothetical protein